jgi:subfamily B ATP-binding cassette protein HlyB/CyaB
VTVTATLPLSAHHTALRCLFIISLRRGVMLKPENFNGFNETDTVGSVLRVMGSVGLQGKVLTGCSWKKVTRLGYAAPLLAVMENGHWVVILETTETGGKRHVILLDPQTEKDGSKAVLFDDFAKEWSGTLVLCKKVQRLDDENQPFGLRWFLPEILRQKQYLRTVAIAAILSSVIAFSMPLMFQILIDKVITHHSYQTLITLVMVFALLSIFDGVFNYTRQYLMMFVTNKIDARLASRVFQHLVSLPLSFFEQTTAGILTRHMQQTETIRHFLTGRLFQTALDAVSLPFVLVILLLYSVKLTLVVLFFSAIIAAIIGIMVPVFRHHLEQLYAAEGSRQGHLVETIHGMRTVKSLALEPSRMDTWNEAIALGVRRKAAVGRISALAGVLTQGLEKTMQISVLALGAVDIFTGALTIGALVAFNMVSGRVTGPLVQIVGLINEYQETALAVKMLGHVMQHPPERKPDGAALTPEVTGAIEFHDITFTYPGASTPALDQVSFDVREGEVIGIVGRSGSGKTTVTRLIQGIQTAQSGMIRVDGIDIRQIDLKHLRKSIGVVLQENFLFRGTLRQNLAAARPDATLDEIIAAARMAGADEFIERLPLAYETFVEENGANFSGGQRQRIAIARALLTAPRLLIFDEATSALDPESEAIIQDHLNEIANGRTLVIVSHRLTSLASADVILVLERGKVVDFAPHKVLLDRCEIYQRLWHQQTKSFA